MAVKIPLLQLIYGLAGAREKFEELVTQLVKAEYPDAAKVRTVQGDGGIDVYVGDYGSAAGIDVYQAKWFINGLGDDQKEQIRRSFRRVRDSSEFTAKTWTLCLPIDMSGEETLWFQDWKEKQADVEIRKPWDGTKLESLLFEPKNRGIKEEFFKEEHLKQIREMHGLLSTLLQELEERLPRHTPLALYYRTFPLDIGKAHVLDATHAVIELVVTIELQNHNTVSVLSWHIVGDFEMLDPDQYLTRMAFPNLSLGRLNLFHMTILPTMTKETDLIIGLIVDRNESLEAQMRRKMDPLNVKFHIISDNHVGEDRTVDLSGFADWDRLLAGMKAALVASSISFIE